MKRDSTGYAAPAPFADTKDCVVRALAAATGCSYKQSSAIFSAAGRKLKQGTYTDISHTVHEQWLAMRLLPNVEGLDLGTFMRLAPKGSFVVHKRSHAFAVVDGVLHDWERGTHERTLIRRAWQVTEATLAKLEATKGLFE